MSKQLSWYRLLCSTSILGIAMVSCIPAQAAPETSSVDLSSEQLDIVPSGEGVPTPGLSATQADLELAQAVETPMLATPPTSMSQIAGTQGDADFPADPSLHTPDASLGQVTSVSQLSDVQPDDWAFQAIQSLVERYGCVAGYPDGTFRPSRAMSRREAAALVNACLDNLSNRFATKEDLDALKALQDEFAAELATLRGRVDGLEARVATVEAQQFSTTTKLNGEAIFAFSGVAGDNPTNGADISGRVSLNQRTRLNFITSFTGKDRLYTRLQSSNRPVNFDDPGIPGIIDNTGTLQTRVAFDTGNFNNEVRLDRLDYRFPIGDKLDVTIFANAAFHHYYATTINPYFEGFGGGKGALSFFGERNPIYRIGTVGIPGVAGVGTSYMFNEENDLRLDLGYLAGRANQATATILANGEDEGGLIGGTYSALAQLSIKPTENSQIGLTYMRNEAPDGLMRFGTGTAFSNNPFDGSALSGNSFGFEGTVKLADWLAVGGWFGYTIADEDNTNNKANIINGAINFAFPDLGIEGATGGLIFGVPPTVIDNDIALREDPDQTFHLEALYSFPVNDFITITPGVIYLINPEGNSANSDILVGVIRTTFKF
ncbi:iron uptake porin [Acaryochloris sp. IP29b_bin.137]|uniref:iron uptake porin n=1 Tax=Acaryochloris sp. IP29b_bin.137 TaxID=2969217 RepID=UPI0026384877|nr:iron uptake porin [Acaryochloris sp. IP29b_bin.137]